MNETRFAARNAHREFHWAWGLVPFASIAVALLIASLVFKPGEAPAPTLAANTTLIAAETAAGQVLAAKPAADWPVPAAVAVAEIEKRPPTLK